MRPADLISATHALLGDRVRLAIMATLASAEEPLDFNTLLDSLGVTKGNLSSHIQKLEGAGLVVVKKEFVERKPKTTYECTKSGRVEIRNYLAKVESLLKQTRSGGKNA
jgi:DNA-binding HxlR family transcriptional regulator